MERPTKRPRLSMFEQSPSGAELDSARYSNDMTLKNRFESIFAKYTQDFTGIGDEVDILTGEVVVNNGHLESMENETDPGIDHLVGDFTSAGRSMLRAMTVTLNPDLPGPDDVLMSIEAIAENAAFTDEVSTDDSEDQLFEKSRLPNVSSLKSTPMSADRAQLDESIEPYHSDSDSLFEKEEEEQEQERRGSVDSLFERDESDSMPPVHDLEESIEPTTYNANVMREDEDVIARFGPSVGKEVLNLIGQRKEAHIEPAWRIPVQLDTVSARRSTPRITSSVSMEESPQARHNVSLWRAPNPRKISPRRKPQEQHIREESIDPLQDDFVSEGESQNETQSVGEIQDADPESGYEDEFSEEILTQAAATGECPYCELQFGNKSGVMAHWDRWLKQKAKRQSKDDDPHDLDLIEKIRSFAIVRIRLPRLVVYDFRTMVELHEGAGMTFDEIAASRTLRTRKTGLKLQDIYNKHRTPPSKEGPSDVDNWTKNEELALEKMCKNSLATMTTLRRGLKSRDELEIGNHLANMWLAQLEESRDRGEQTQLASGPNTDRSIPPSSYRSGIGTVADNYTIKQEDSEDELFQ